MTIKNIIKNVQKRNLVKYHVVTEDDMYLFKSEYNAFRDFLSAINYRASCF
jgi:hypothetical protein